jgi:hypothetical protein
MDFVFFLHVQICTFIFSREIDVFYDMLTVASLQYSAVIVTEVLRLLESMAKMVNMERSAKMFLLLLIGCSLVILTVTVFPFFGFCNWKQRKLRSENLSMDQGKPLYG